MLLIYVVALITTQSIGQRMMVLTLQPRTLKCKIQDTKSRNRVLGLKE